ncbi:cache domain-containing protein [Actinoplanes sp. NPDC023936]|uniref:cache domain-containing protein n=1 Tax=Actinoplanes sp. NPDC023936 TaxID=3154910 RepID=UPI0033FAD7A7
MGQTSTRTAAPAGTDLAGLVTTMAEQTFDVADRLRHRVEALFVARGRPAVSADLAEVGPEVTGMLGGLITGAGVITTPLSDGRHGVEWWMGTTPAPTRLALDVDPESDDFAAVGRQQWFTVPRDTGRRHVTGPYVDYVCAEQYTLTFTVPIFAGGVFAGVTGADVFVGDIERILRPALRAVGAPVVLVNRQGRIVAGTTAHHITGSLIREPHIHAALQAGVAQTLPGGVTVAPCGGGLPLAVLTWA